ncbi:MAG: bifunctional diaminohydroxyphosphoribosylaminopyrimidine deaminase/5-amino-6-(5-phosphoribosylamino)uracil reductase RibD [Pseudomonadota bacterium]
MTSDSNDIWHMRSALSLARTGLGRTWPNPTVGCVIVKEGIVLARARTADGGRPHAETIALNKAGEQAKGATAYVTLEPCSHQGKTGPCSAALIESGVKRVVIACVDSDERVSGEGIRMLEQAGIQVDVGVCEQEARDLNVGFFLNREGGRPFITLKTASTLDSKMVSESGKREKITGKEAHHFAQVLRAQHDAILIGVNTVLADNPSLTTRLDGVHHSIIRIVLDTHLKLKGDEKLFDSIEENPVFILTTKNMNEAKTLHEKGAEIVQVDANREGQIDLHQVMKALAEKGLTRILVDGGAQVVTSFLKEDLCDEFLWFRSGLLMGSQAYNSIQEFPLTNLNKLIKLNFEKRRILGDDVLDIYTKAR